MLEVHKSHDRLFKSSMSDIRVAEDFFKHNLPNEVLESLDLATLKLSPHSYVDQTLQEFISDVLYEVKILNEDGYLYILTEHQSKIDYIMPFRILQYTVLIWADYLKKIQSHQDKTKGKMDRPQKRKAKILGNNNKQKLPLVIPIVFYNGKAKYTGPRELKDLMNAPQHLIEQFLFKPFHLIDTHDLEDESLQEQHWAGVMTFVMKHIHDREFYLLVHKMIHMFKKMSEASQQVSKQNSCSQLIITILQYVLVSGNTQHKDLFLNEVVEGLNDPTVGGELMSIAKQFIEEGIIKGRAEGILQGISQGISQGMTRGMVTVLNNQLNNKFGSVPREYKMRIELATADELSFWLNNIIRAKSIEAVFVREATTAVLV